MRRKGRKVIKPVGSELMDYLNKGYAICNKCGAVVPTLTAKRHAKCLTTKALSTEESPVTGAFFFLFWR